MSFSYPKDSPKASLSVEICDIATYICTYLLNTIIRFSPLPKGNAEPSGRSNQT